MMSSCAVFSSFSNTNSSVGRRPQAHQLRSNSVWAAYEAPARWVDQVSQRLNDLVSLDAGWDGYNARPVRLENAAFASSMISAICNASSPAPQIVPGPNGDLQVEWHTACGDIELRVIRPNVVRAWFSDGEDDEGIEVELTRDFEIVAAWLKTITEADLAAEPAPA